MRRVFEHAHQWERGTKDLATLVVVKAVVVDAAAVGAQAYTVQDKTQGDAFPESGAQRVNSVCASQCLEETNAVLLTELQQVLEAWCSTVCNSQHWPSVARWR